MSVRLRVTRELCRSLANASTYFSVSYYRNE
jgi:hypothetical protein